ncbi:hypothetical protein K435DRAFT_7668 [Dendrothele bispora CBS 962.96]|uniref:Uncharacterized protein n=1 Tax=Dendrothele bispora (strain CBS 962.96) TaxID=1314807 RepID=A0A4V4HIX4_DENBC|nr:hypothetical protein K435DRAFT_7668 [Dendrothele bispora CBS 962.96]
MSASRPPTSRPLMFIKPLSAAFIVGTLPTDAYSRFPDGLPLSGYQRYSYETAKLRLSLQTSIAIVVGRGLRTQDLQAMTSILGVSRSRCSRVSEILFLIFSENWSQVHSPVRSTLLQCLSLWDMSVPQRHFIFSVHSDPDVYIEILKSSRSVSTGVELDLRSVSNETFPILLEFPGLCSLELRRPDNPEMLMMHYVERAIKRAVMTPYLPSLGNLRQVSLPVGLLEQLGPILCAISTLPYCRTLKLDKSDWYHISTSSRRMKTLAEAVRYGLRDFHHLGWLTLPGQLWDRPEVQKALIRLRGLRPNCERVVLT